LISKLPQSRTVGVLIGVLKAMIIDFDITFVYIVSIRIYKMIGLAGF